VHFVVHATVVEFIDLVAFRDKAIVDRDVAAIRHAGAIVQPRIEACPTVG
jgi:hypothetical protein